MAAAALRGLAAAALVAVAAAESDRRNQHHGFWVKLRALAPDAGTLEPPFEEDGSYYALHVADVHKKSVRFNFVLNREMYGQGFPDIIVDGKRIEYNPLSDPQLTLPLDDDIGPYDREVNIRVQDPNAMKGWFGYDTHAHHDYTIRVTQPPDYDEVVRASSIVVLASDGSSIQGDADFDPATYEYSFVLDEQDTGIDAQANCSEFATRMLYNGKPAASGSRLPVAVPGATETVIVQCTFLDEAWSPNTYERTYTLHFKRHVTMNKHTAQLSLKMMPSDGYCVMKEDKKTDKSHRPGASASSVALASRERMLLQQERAHERALLTSWTDAQLDPQGDIICRTHVQRAELVPLFRGLPGAHVSIKKESDKTGEKMINGLPHVIDIPKGSRHKYILSVAIGDAVREYTVTVLWPEQCAAMECPPEKVLKAEAILNQSSAWSRLCLEERCTDADVPHCCMNRASCGTFGFQCPAHHILRHDANDVLCKGAECLEEEASLCCGKQGSCQSFNFSCGSKRVLAREADGLSCKKEECAKKDADVCCEDRASCGSYEFGCASDRATVGDPNSALCAGAECTKSDHEVCCEPKASCHDFALGWECPAGQAVIPQGFGVERLCGAGECTQEDSGICCAPREPCAQLECPKHWLPQADREELLCTGTKCEKEKDLPVCCYAQATCASSFNDTDCPAGQFLIPKAHSTHCKGLKCSAEEKSMCCGKFALCTDFRFDCPVGHMHRLSSSRAHCKAEKCTEEDSDVCCAPIPGVRGAESKHLSAIGNEAVLKYLSDNPESIRKVGGSWLTGLEDRDCHSTCEAHGLVCTEAGLYAHNTEVDTEEKVIGLMKLSSRLDAMNYRGDCPDKFGDHPDVPQFWAEGCYRSMKDRPIESFNCSAAPSEESGQMKHRLCYCHEVVSDISALGGESESEEQPQQADELGGEGDADDPPPTPEEEAQMAAKDMTREIFEFVGGLIINHDCWHVDPQDWSDAKSSFCSRYGILVSAADRELVVGRTAAGSNGSRHRYSERSLVLEEGGNVGDFFVETLSECMQKCDEVPECKSFSFSADSGMIRKGCNLKDKAVSADDEGATDIAKGDYMTYYRDKGSSSTHSTGRNRYEQRSLVMDEGSSVGDYAVASLPDCIKRCDETAECRSFSFSADARLSRKGCNLKDKDVTALDDGSNDTAKGDYMTYFKVPGAAAADYERLDSASVGRRAWRPSGSGALLGRLSAGIGLTCAALLAAWAMVTRASGSRRTVALGGGFEQLTGSVLPEASAAEPSACDLEK